MLQISKNSTASLKSIRPNTTRTHLEIMDSGCRLHKKLNCADQGHSLHILERLISKRREDGPAQSAPENGTKPYDAKWRRKMDKIQAIKPDVVNCVAEPATTAEPCPEIARFRNNVVEESKLYGAGMEVSAQNRFGQQWRTLIFRPFARKSGHYRNNVIFHFFSA